MTGSAVRIARHDGRDELIDRIMPALAEAGKDVARLTTTISRRLMRSAPPCVVSTGARLTPSDPVIDVGSVPGGPTRLRATTYSCEVSSVERVEARDHRNPAHDRTAAELCPD